MTDRPETDPAIRLLTNAETMWNALVEIDELVDGYVDIDRNGQPNLAMRVQTIINNTIADVDGRS